LRNSGHACVLARVLRSWARARARPLIGAEESIQPLERFLFVEAKRVSFFHVVVVVVADLSTRLSCSECGQMEATEYVAAVAGAAAAASSMSLGRSRSK
jgi:hypothetical protein